MKKSVFSKLLSFVGNYKIYMFLSLLFAFISVLFTLYIPILIGKCIDLIIAKNNVDFTSLKSYFLEIIIMIFVVGVTQWLMNVCNNKITFNISRDMRKLSFDKIQRLPVSYIDSHQNGDIIARVVSDIDQVSDGLLMGFSQFFTGIVTIIGTLCFMISINYKITIVVVLVTPLSFFIARFIAKKTFKMFSLQSKTRGEQTSFIDEMISNQKVCDSYLMDEDNLKKFDEINDKFASYSLKATFFSSITNPATRFVNSIVYASVALFGAVLAITTGSITVGVLSCFLSYANQYTKPFNEISSVVTELQNALACAKRVFDFIEEYEITPDPQNSIEIVNPKGNIEISNLNFSYNNSKTILNNLNIAAKSGKTIAIVGKTGCGKTTLINLLMRFYDPNSGSIKFDDNELYNIKVSSLRSNIGMVLQDTWLKNASVKDNIKFGNPNATDEEIINASKNAYAHSFISRLENGYDTIIGEGGVELSKGQKQLICISRLMLSPPPILILDEATSSIDARTQIKIQKAFNKLMNGRTTFIVAHRLSTIQNADKIIVMSEGQVIEEGTHQELLVKKSYYYDLYNSQFPHS